MKKTRKLSLCQGEKNIIFGNGGWREQKYYILGKYSPLNRGGSNVEQGRGFNCTFKSKDVLLTKRYFCSDCFLYYETLPPAKDIIFTSSLDLNV